MSARRAAVWGLIVLAFALGVFSLVGSALLGAAYVLLLVAVTAFHWSYSCRSCSNVSCAINSASPDFFLGRPRRHAPEGFSDLNASVAGIPLVLVIALGFVGAWLAGWVPFVVAVILLVASGVAYVRGTCSECTNHCPANRNPAYREWKATS